jgi:prolycopene isomerase
MVFANNSAVNPGQCPPGKSIVRCALLADGRFWCGLPEQQYRNQKAELTEYCLDQFERFIPDIRDRIEICEVGTPHTMWRYSWNPLGAIYGYANSPDAHSVFRPGPKTPIPGLYLAGAWTFPSGGFEGAMVSGENTARLIFDEIEGAGRRAE